MMADNQLLNDNGGDGDDILVYTGGEQQVPRDVKRVRIAENIDTIPAWTFYDRTQLIEVEGHKKLNKIETLAFYNCFSLRRVTKMQGLREIGSEAFYYCTDLSDIDLDKLEIIGYCAFHGCKSLSTVNIPSIRILRPGAFSHCDALTDVVFGVKLEIIEDNAFVDCTALRRIVIPLKDNLIIGNDIFTYCGNLSRVDTLVGGIHKTISSLHMESWRNEMQEEIDRINQTLPNTHSFEKTTAIQQWITRVLNRMEHFKTEHKMLVKEAVVLLELALWKAKILDEGGEKNNCVNVATEKVKIDAEATRIEHRVTCGASIVIKNVLPFLELS